MSVRCDVVTTTTIYRGGDPGYPVDRPIEESRRCEYPVAWRICPVTDQQRSVQDLRVCSEHVGSTLGWLLEDGDVSEFLAQRWDETLFRSLIATGDYYRPSDLGGELVGVNLDDVDDDVTEQERRFNERTDAGDTLQEHERPDPAYHPLADESTAG